MSDRLLAGDGTFSVLLVLNDQTPLLCTAVHIVNNSGQPINFTIGFDATAPAPYTGREFGPLTAQAGLDKTFQLPTPLAIVTTTNFKGQQGWAVQGLTEFAVSQG